MLKGLGQCVLHLGRKIQCSEFLGHTAGLQHSHHPHLLASSSSSPAGVQTQAHQHTHGNTRPGEFHVWHHTLEKITGGREAEGERLGEKREGRKEGERGKY